MDYLTIGVVIDSFGLDGTLKLLSKTEFQELRYKKGNKVFCYSPKDNSIVELTVTQYRTSGNLDFVKFEEINTKEEADLYKGKILQIIKAKSDLKEGYFYHSDLIGCFVYNEQNNYLGEVKAVEEFPAQKTLRVQRKNKQDFFVPFVKEFIIKVDIENKCVIIKVIEGML